MAQVESSPERSGSNTEQRVVEGARRAIASGGWQSATLTRIAEEAEDGNVAGVAVRTYAIARLLDECGALDACSALAREIVERAWEQLDPVLPESQCKLTFRAFSWYVLERHY
jgi:geranylgeranyl pyrophosphate synthase